METSVSFTPLIPALAATPAPLNGRTAKPIAFLLPADILQMKAVPLSPGHIHQTPAASHTSKQFLNHPVYYYCYIQSVKSLYPISRHEIPFSRVLKCTRRVLVALIALPCIAARLVAGEPS